jgi:hypothetical protein
MLQMDRNVKNFKEKGMVRHGIKKEKRKKERKDERWKGSLCRDTSHSKVETQR